MTPARRRAAVVAVVAGMAVNFLGDWILGVQIENFRGMATFTPAWVADVFVVNFLVGLVVARLFGRHAKWLAIVPPFLVRCLSYAYLYFVQSHHGDFFLQLHLHYWGPTVILAVECSNIGGILGEVLMGVYSRKRPTASPTTITSISASNVAQDASTPERIPEATRVQADASGPHLAAGGGAAK